MEIKRQLLFLFFFTFIFQAIILSQAKNVDSLLLLVKSAELSNKKCDLLNEAARLISSKDPIKSIDYAEDAFQIALVLRYNSGIAKSNYLIGRAHERISNNVNSLEKYFAALVIYENLNDESEIANIKFRIAVVFKNISNYYKALEYCLGALTIMEKLNDKIGISKTYNIMGSIYKYLNDYEKALEFYYKGAGIQRKYNNGVSSNIYNNIGIIYVRTQKYNEALEYYLKSLQLRLQSNNKAGVAHSYNNIGVVRLEQEKYDSAFIYFQKSRVLKIEVGDKRGLANTYHNIGECNFKTGEFKKAFKYIDSSMVYAQKIGFLESVKNNYELLSEIYLKKKQYDSSLFYYKLFSNLKDSLLGGETLTKVTQLEFEYEQQKAVKLSKLSKQKDRLVNIIIIGALVSLLLVVFLVYRNLRNKYKHDKLKQVSLEMEKNNLLTKIEIKDKELARYIIHLSEKNESLSSIRITLKALEKKLKDENKSQVRSVINKLNSSISSNIWDEFDLRFVNVYNKFYDNLLTKHPDVTTNEKRLAAFLKLNMSSKEISMITKQSVHSITVARTRLRKKIGLANKDVSLVTYFSGL